MRISKKSQLQENNTIGLGVSELIMNNPIWSVSKDEIFVYRLTQKAVINTDDDCVPPSPKTPIGWVHDTIDASNNAKLLLKRIGFEEEEEHILKIGKTTIGRNEMADIVTKSVFCSRAHCNIWHHSNGTIQITNQVNRDVIVFLIL